MEDKHIDDEWGVVDLRLGSVVVNPTGTLHSLWDVPAATRDNNLSISINTITHNIYGPRQCGENRTIISEVLGGADSETYRDHPIRGGAAQVMAMIQVKARPAMACFSPKRKLVIGLQTTM